MRTSTGSRVFVVSVRIVVRTSVRLVRRCRPWVARVTEVVVELCAAERGSATALTRYTRYAVIGGVTASTGRTKPETGIATIFCFGCVVVTRT